MARSGRPRADASRLKYAADHTLMDTPFRHTNTTCAESRGTSIGWAFIAKAAEAASSNMTPTTRTDLDFMEVKTIGGGKSLQRSVVAQLSRLTAQTWDCDIEIARTWHQ